VEERQNLTNLEIFGGANVNCHRLEKRDHIFSSLAVATTSRIPAKLPNVVGQSH
jgi:hypothetical protein